MIKITLNNSEFPGMVKILLILFFLFLTGCSTPTSVILGVTNQELVVKGFGRGQTLFGLQCIACPHVGAKVIVSAPDGTIICSSSNEIIVPETEGTVLKLRCPNLDLHQDKKVLVNIEGFIGGRSDEIKKFNFEREMVITFEKV